MLLNTFGFKVGLAHFSNQSLGLVKIRPIVMIHKVGFWSKPTRLWYFRV